MKQFLFFVLLLACIQRVAGQACNPLTLTTQSQVNALGATGCTTVTNLVIYGGRASSNAVDQIVDLTPLQGITAVTGPVTLVLNDLTNIQGLDNIRTIGSDLVIQSATSAANPFGLGSSSLELVGGDLIIYNNPGITAITGFPLLRSARRISISGNAALGAVSGFGSFQSTGTLQFYQCPVLRSISGFDNLTSITLQTGLTTTNFSITDLPLLQTISSFPSLTTVGTFQISNNPNLQHITGFNSLQNVQQGFVITGNGVTSISGFNGGMVLNGNGNISINGNPQLQYISGFTRAASGAVSIDSNAALLGVTGFNNGSFAATIGISNNSYLTSVSAFQNSDVAGTIQLSNNARLATISGFTGSQAPATITLASNTQLQDFSQAFAFGSYSRLATLNIIGNTLLSACAQPWICAYLRRGGYASISNNAPACTSAAVLQACQSQLVVSTGSAASPMVVPAGTYSAITVTGTGFGVLAGDVTVSGPVVVQSGGGLSDGCHLLSGTGSFTLASGATLGICSPAGITTGATGAVQVTGTRSFSPDATYLYSGTVAQVTGNALPATVRELGVNNPSGVSLSQAVQVRQRVNLPAGNLNLVGLPLTLLSDAAGTALVNNSGGQVVGATGTMQRYIGTNTAGTGYRHYSSPVQAETLATLATAGYAPDFSGAAAYNASPTPGAVTPFPTVFQYDQDRIATAASNYSPFDKGYEAITSGAAAMEAGRGYAVNAPGTALVDFTGVFYMANITRTTLNRTGADGGWHLLGNPYPAPLDWSTLTTGPGNSLDNLDGALYVFQSSGPYAGAYRTYLAGAPGNSSPLIPAGSGFFVHTTTVGTAGTLRLTNANRVTTFGAQPAFGRTTADTRPQVALNLRNAANTRSDEATLYAEARATAGVDAAYDAVKLANPTGLSLALLAPTGEALAIDGRPALAAGTVVPLQMDAPAAGAYTLRATLANLPAGLTAYLRDAATGQQVNLTAQPAPTVQLAAGRSTRFSMVFGQNALGTAPGLTAAQVSLFPNPTPGKATLELAGLREQGAVAVDVLNVLGQTVRHLSVRPKLGFLSQTLDLRELPTGVYMVRIHAQEGTVVKRLVKE